MKCVIALLFGTITALVMLLSFKTQDSATASAPPAIVATDSATGSSGTATTPSTSSSASGATSTGTTSSAAKTITGNSVDTRWAWSRCASPSPAASP